MAAREVGRAEIVDSDPGSLSQRIRTTTARLAATAAALTDDQVREPSLLPGWSRGHVLTHVARNADGLRNLLIWARTGVETPQYPEPGRSAATRDDAVGQRGAGWHQSGAGRWPGPTPP